MEDLKAGSIPAETAWGLTRIKNDEAYKTFLEKYLERVERDEIAGSDEKRMELMQASNPRSVTKQKIIRLLLFSRKKSTT